MFDEIIPTIVEVVIEHKKPVSIEEIADSSGFETGEITRSVNLLGDLGLLTRSTDKSGKVVYQLIKELKGIHLAKAAQLGVDLASFEGHFKIDKKEKKLALELATQAEKIKHLEINKRKPLMQKRGYFTLNKSDDVCENLMLLLEASNATLYEYLETVAQKDPYLKLLMSMHQQAENSLHDYADNLR